MIVKLWSLYLVALQTAPLLTKCLTSAAGFILGDGIAQLIAKERYNVLRTLRFATIGFCLHAPIADTWFLFLEHNILPKAPTRYSLLGCCESHGPDASHAYGACCSQIKAVQGFLPC